MVLRKQVLAVPLGGGMDTSKDPKITQGSIKVLNGDFSISGQISKREGEYSITKNLDSYNYGSRIASHRDGLIVWDYDGYMYAPDSGKITKISTLGGTLDVERKEVFNSYRSIGHYVDFVKFPEYNIVTYTGTDPAIAGTDGYSIQLEIFDGYTGKVKSTTECYSDSIKRAAKLIKCYGYAYAFWFDDTTAKYAIVSSSASVTGPGSITSAAAGKGNMNSFDVCLVESTGGTASRIILVYPNTSDNVQIHVLNGEMSIQASTTIAKSSGYEVTDCAVWRMTSTLFVVAWAENDGSTEKTYSQVFNLSLSKPYGLSTESSLSYPDDVIQNITGVAINSTKSRCYITRVDTSGDLNSPEIDYFENDWSGGSTSTGGRIRFHVNGWVVVKPAVVNDSNKHILGLLKRSWDTENTAQDQLSWVDEDGYSIGRSLIGITKYDGYIPDSYGVLTHLDPDDSDGYVMRTAATYVSRLSVDDFQTSDQFQIAELDLNANPEALAYAEKEEITILSNSTPYEVDGSRIVEAGFDLYPEPVLGAGSTSATGSLDSYGVYKYVAVYEEVDANGVLHRSAPTPTPLEVTLGASDLTMVLLFPSYYGRRSNTVIAYYRTINGGTEYYRAGSVPNTWSSGYQYVYDYLSDDDLVDNEALYTDSGEIENIAPYPHRIAAIWQQRYVYVDRENEDTRLYYSKEFIPKEGIGYNDLFVINVDSTGGAITALFGFSDKLIIFKKNKIFVTAGNGFNSIGGGANYTTPWMISPTIGCIDQRSIARVPDGIIFQSEKGLWLLSQNEQVVPVGQPVQRYSEAQSFIGAGTIGDRNEAWFIPSDGYACVYNYLKDKWSLSTNRTGTAALSRDNKMLWLDGDGNIVETKHDTYSDDDENFYGLKVETGWFSFAGLGGFQRVYNILIIGQNLEQHQLRVKVAYDFDAYYTDDETYDATQLTEFGLEKYFNNGLGVLGDNQSYLVEIPTSRQKCTSVRLSIEDIEKSGSYEGMSLTAVAFEVGVKPRINPTSNGRKV